MRKHQLADAESSRLAIRQEIMRSSESHYVHRLHGLLLITAGLSAAQVANLFGEDRRTVQRWVAAFGKRLVRLGSDFAYPGRAGKARTTPLESSGIIYVA